MHALSPQTSVCKLKCCARLSILTVVFLMIIGFSCWISLEKYQLKASATALLERMKPQLLPASTEPQLLPASNISIIEIQHSSLGLQASTPNVSGLQARSLDQGTNTKHDAECKSFVKRLNLPRAQYCKVGPFRRDTSKREHAKKDETQSRPHKIALVIRGESFRRNEGMYDRIIKVTGRSQKCQIDASESQVQHLIAPIEACGIEVDVFIISWKPEGNKVVNATNLMSDVYRPRLVIAEWHDHSYTLSAKVNGQHDNYFSALRAVANYSQRTEQPYYGLFVVRADLLFKRPLINLPDADWSKLLFIFHEWESGGGFPAKNIEQRVPDTIFWYPWDLMNCVYKFGWNEHNAAAVHLKVGLSRTGLMMPNEFHDSNAMADWNPVYTQVCRKAQRFDVHGGPAYALFNAHELLKESEAVKVGESFRHSIYLQGDPRSVPPAAITMHSWSTRSNVKKCLHTIFGNVPQEEDHQHFNGSSDKFGWIASIRSMGRSFEFLAHNKELVFRKRYHPNYVYDRVTFARLDYVFPRNFISLYDLDTSQAIFINFGAQFFPLVPTLIVMSHAIAWKFGMYLRKVATTSTSENAPRTENAVEEWLTSVTGMAVKRIQMAKVVEMLK